MSVLIGCSPSTGSSLLRRMLNRHSEIFCGSETSLFAKEALYHNWQEAKNKINRPSLFGLPNAGWHLMMGLTLENDYGYNPKQFRELVKRSNDDFNSFVADFYKPILAKNNKKLWVEKTPSNAFTLAHFLDHFEEGKVIHIVRHPLDTIASLHNRGMTLYNAVAVYLLNTAMALDLKDNPRCYTLKYELLVTNPETELSKICHFLSLDFEGQMLEQRKNERGTTTMKGWNYDETQKVASGSVNRFDNVSDALAQNILQRVKATNSLLPNNSKSISELALALDYEVPTIELSSKLLETLKIERKDDIKSRHFSRAHFRKNNYPIVFSDELV